MRKYLFEKYFSDRYTLLTASFCGEEILEGKLMPLLAEDRTIEITKGIPRFVTLDEYAENFGLQWNLFRRTQLDSHTGLCLSKERLFRNTKWRPSELKGKKVLEVGSGAGRFTEILVETGCELITFDLSSAVDVNYKSNRDRGNIFFLQADIYNLPFQDLYFDYIFCFGVLQHTPNPEEAYMQLYRKLNHGGKLSLDYYLKFNKPTPWSTPKYFWRPITRRIKPSILLRIIKCYIPFWLPIDTLIRKIPKYGPKILACIPIPCWNYLDLGLTRKQRYEWAILDTFDALGASFDQPKTLQEVNEMIRNEENFFQEVFYGSNGVVANIQKK